MEDRLEDQLRRSAGFWRGVAMGTMVLGIIGSAVIAVVVARGPYGEEFDAALFFTILIPSVLGLMLSLGFFFMGTGIMEGLAELIGLTARLSAATAAPATRRATLSSPTPRAAQGQGEAAHTRLCPNCSKFVDHELETCPHCEADLTGPGMEKPAVAPQPDRPLLSFFGPKPRHDAVSQAATPLPKPCPSCRKSIHPEAEMCPYCRRETGFGT